MIEYALSLMPFKNVSIDTPQGINYQGKRMASNKICGVSILRAGETMEQAVSEVCKNIRIGKILIQTNQQTGEPEVILEWEIKNMTSIMIFVSAALLFEASKRYQRL